MTSENLSNELESYQHLFSNSKTSPSDSETQNELIKVSPLVYWPVHTELQNSSSSGLAQYGVLCYESPATQHPISPILLNTNTPWSAFLCGSQGSGKSHTLSCMIENCLLDDRMIGKNPNPLAGIVFHYDRSQTSGACEAAYLCSKVQTRVLVSKSNYGKLKHQYESVAAKEGGILSVEKLEIHAAHLDTERVKTLMAVGSDSEMPLYMHVILKILREMAEASGGLNAFNYQLFKKHLKDQGFMDRQAPALNMRLDLLESFLDTSTTTKPTKKHTPIQTKNTRDLLKGEPCVLTIIDLTDPVIDPETACVLFDICLSIFMSQTPCGKIVALDEAHNYMTDSSAAATQFTNRLLKTIREQRHQGARVVIATQEPTINTALLDLCSITMVHRCTSPSWFQVLRKHVAGLYLSRRRNEGEEKEEEEDGDDVFRRIVQLGLGESLLFCPMAVVGIEESGGLRRMDHRFVTVRTRKRITADGGVSRLADDADAR